MTLIKTRNQLLESFILISIFIIVYGYYIFPMYLGYYDEFFSLIFAIIITIIVLTQNKIYLYKEEKIIILLLFSLGFWGLLSNYLTLPKHKTEIAAIIGDFVVVFKAYIAYFGIRLMTSQIDSVSILKKISFYAEWIFYSLVLLIFLDYIFDLFPKYSRYGLKSLQLFFIHPSRYSFAFSFIFLALFNKYIDSKKWFLFLILVLGLLSLRVKYFGFVTIAYAMFYFRDYIKRIPRKQFFIYLIIAFGILFYIFKDQVNMYFANLHSNTAWSRAVLLVKSIEIGYDFFPYGTGFGTYACYFSGKYYSWVYTYYGIQDVWGISKNYHMFIADQFWPMVLGQFGYPGLILYGIIIYKYIMLFLKLLKENSYSLISQRMIMPLLALLLLIIDSSSDAIFTQDRAVAIFIIIALTINLQLKKNDNVSE